MERIPLASVRTFAVVARLLSISRAAEQLSVTPSAVSHQIKILETYLGAPLFRREKNKLVLTAVGKQYMAQTSEALSLLLSATKSAKATNQQHILRIAAPPSLSVLWLVERLSRFTTLHPDIDLTLTASSEPPALLHGTFDVGFWYGSGIIPGLTIDPLGVNRAFPICNPALLEGKRGPHTATDLGSHILLDSSDETYYKEPRQPGWSVWLQPGCLSKINGQRHMDFTPRVLMHAAVRAGCGVGLTRSLLALDGLSTKEITVPFGPAIPLNLTYNFVCPRQLTLRRDIALFREWVMAEAASSTKEIEKLLKPYIEK